MNSVRTRSLTIPNVVISLAFFYGGLAQFIAGMWEGAAGNVSHSTPSDAVI